VKLRAGRSGALLRAISALVLAGLPTTSTRTLRAATAFIALPCAEKICALASSRSLRSMPGPRGRAPTSIAPGSPERDGGLIVATTLFSVGNAQSLSSMTTPCRPGSAAVISEQVQIDRLVGAQHG
jgi:hypothetical protein